MRVENLSSIITITNIAFKEKSHVSFTYNFYFFKTYRHGNLLTFWAFDETTIPDYRSFKTVIGFFLMKNIILLSIEDIVLKHKNYSNMMSTPHFAVLDLTISNNRFSFRVLPLNEIKHLCFFFLDDFIKDLSGTFDFENEIALSFKSFISAVSRFHSYSDIDEEGPLFINRSTTLYGSSLLCLKIKFDAFFDFSFKIPNFYKGFPCS